MVLLSSGTSSCCLRIPLCLMLSKLQAGPWGSTTFTGQAKSSKSRRVGLGLPCTIRRMPCAYRPPTKMREKRKPREPQRPTRASSRLKGESAAGDYASELALFVINGDCPRCGKV